MQNFTIGFQINSELDDFTKGQVLLASLASQESNRTLSAKKTGYWYNQGETIALIDLYFNSVFESSQKDNNGRDKIFLNIGKFRTEVSAKQIDLDTSNFRFLPDDYADPFTSIFLNKEFREWAKDSEFGAIVNQCVENFPKYGSVVMKKIGNKIEFVPLQNVKNEQSADDLQSASYVIEEHPGMYRYELEEMRGWDLKGLDMKFNEKIDVYERYGHVPTKWLDKLNDRQSGASEDDSVDAVVICANVKDKQTGKDSWHIFFADEVNERPYREVHWSKQHGRWLGVGVMEDLFANQKAKNTVINLIRKSLHWSGKRIFQSASQEVAAKNFVRNVEDGDVLEVAPNAPITEVPLQAKTNNDFTSFLAEFEKNADQKAFTYEVATGESLPSGTPFRLGVILSNATNSFFKFKQEKLGLFLKDVILDFMVPKFLKNMGDKKHVVQMFSGEAGFETLKAAAAAWAMEKKMKDMILDGVMADPSMVYQASQGYDLSDMIAYEVSYKDVKYKFDLTITGEEVDLAAKLETLKTLAQILQQAGDPRFGKILERIAELSGESMSRFGKPASMGMQPQIPSPNQVPNVPGQSNASPTAALPVGR